MLDNDLQTLIEDTARTHGLRIERIGTGAGPGGTEGQFRDVGLCRATGEDGGQCFADIEALRRALADLNAATGKRAGFNHMGHFPTDYPSEGNHAYVACESVWWVDGLNPAPPCRFCKGEETAYACECV